MAENLRGTVQAAMSEEAPRAGAESGQAVSPDGSGQPFLPDTRGAERAGGGHRHAVTQDIGARLRDLLTRDRVKAARGVEGIVAPFCHKEK
jgi:hypothetical protein